MPIKFINTNGTGNFVGRNNNNEGQLKLVNEIESSVPVITPSVTPSVTPSLTVTPSVSNTPSITTSATPSVTPSISITPSVTPSVTPSISITPSVTPSVTPSISRTPSVTPSVTPSISRTPSVTPSVTPSISRTPSVTPSISITPSVTPSISITPSISPSMGVGGTFSQTFTSGQSPGTAIENAWTTFRQSLTGTYTQFVWSSSNGNSITVTDAVKVQQIADALRTATTGTNFSVTIGSNTWRVIQNCSVTSPVPAAAIEFTNVGPCSCNSGYTMRPFIRNANWGGTNQSTCNAPTQTITITFS